VAEVIIQTPNKTVKETQITKTGRSNGISAKTILSVRKKELLTTNIHSSCQLIYLRTTFNV
jgi:hypothetical protein